MELREAIFNRRSVLRFTNAPLNKEIYNELISAAIYAPSASNSQAWKFIAVDDPVMKDKICKNHYSRIIAEAPAGILVLYRNDVSFNNRMYHDHIQSASAAIQNILLAAYDRKIGACWVCELPPQRVVRKIFGIPKHYTVIAYIALGYLGDYAYNQIYGSGNTRMRQRKYPVYQVLSYNSFEEHPNNDTQKLIFIRSVLYYWSKVLKFLPIKRFLFKLVTGKKNEDLKKYWGHLWKK